MNQLHSTILAFDFGTQNIGVAVGQTITQTARGIATLKAKNGRPRWQEILALIAEYQPKHLIIGLPLNMDGSDSDMSILATNFAEQLATRSKIAAVLHDERLSTRTAKSQLEEAREFGIAKNDHELAACLIAQSWMTSRQTEC